MAGQAWAGERVACEAGYSVCLPDAASIEEQGSGWLALTTPNTRVAQPNEYTWLVLERHEVEQLLGHAKTRDTKEGADATDRLVAEKESGVDVSATGNQALPTFTLEDALDAREPFSTAQFEQRFTDLQLLERSKVPTNKLEYDLFQASTYRKAAERTEMDALLPDAVQLAWGALQQGDVMRSTTMRLGGHDYVVLRKNDVKVKSGATVKAADDAETIQTSLANPETDEANAPASETSKAKHQDEQSYILMMGLTSQDDKLYILNIFVPDYPDEVDKLKDNYSVFKLEKEKAKYKKELLQARLDRGTVARKQMESLRIRKT